MADSGAVRVEYAALTDRGRVRSGNEDACGHDAALGLFVVCDGMGGAAAGEVASRMAVQAILEYWHGEYWRSEYWHREHWRKGVDGKAAACRPETLRKQKKHHEADEAAVTVRARLRAAVQEANEQVLQRAGRDQRLRGMGTTALVLYLEQGAEGTRAWLAHVGDSRCYRWRAGELRQMTLDHSLVEEQVRLGHMTAEQAEHSPFRNVITRAVGATEAIDVDVSSELPEPGDIYLLCTDGLTRELGEAEIAAVIAAVLAAQAQQSGGKAMESACEALVRAANEHGGRDNITCILVRVG